MGGVSRFSRPHHGQKKNTAIFVVAVQKWRQISVFWTQTFDRGSCAPQQRLGNNDKNNNNDIDNDKKNGRV